MAQQNQTCPHCGHYHLQRIGVPGIRKCKQCQQFVDLRPAIAWWRKILSA